MYQSILKNWHLDPPPPPTYTIIKLQGPPLDFRPPPSNPDNYCIDKSDRFSLKKKIKTIVASQIGEHPYNTRFLQDLGPWCNIGPQSNFLYFMTHINNFAVLPHFPLTKSKIIRKFLSNCQQIAFIHTLIFVKLNLITTTVSFKANLPVS